ncbi:MAG: hypothetical protein A2583_01090 [Bdellovibrionales bacterium RIFOXYD1_FULL_53_11]|nr:MAG: hypothetical protein A2583_01090 [Bdellovibrionales bacterium RIFOXYD1_FULL_53_11]
MKIDERTFGRVSIAHLEEVLEKNRLAARKIADRVVRDVKAGRLLFVFGSGHSAILSMELYHRAGGCSFVVPVVADYLLPTAGPPVVRTLERTPGAANSLLDRAGPRRGEMIWIVSQSGINGAVVEFALEASRRGLYTVAFTSLRHSRAVKSRHPSGKKLFQVCDAVLDLGGCVGDAAVQITGDSRAGPLSSLGAIFLAHSVLTYAAARLERAGRRCVYTSVNTPEGERRNKSLELKAAKRDPLLR